MGLMENARRKRLKRESTERLQQIVLSGGSHQDYNLALEILSDRMERIGHPSFDSREMAVPRADSLPLSTERDVYPYGDRPPAKGWQDAWEAPHNHKGTPVKGCTGLFGSSYTAGLMADDENLVSVILAHETLGLAIPEGWTSVRGLPGFVDGASSAEIVFWPWTDQRAPTGDDVITRIKSLISLLKAGKKIEVACHGGHGRTGTLLAILAAAQNGWAAEDAVRLLRENYCKNAVESKEQVTFVREVVEALGRWEPSNR